MSRWGLLFLRGDRMDFDYYEQDGHIYQIAKGDPVPIGMQPVKREPAPKAKEAPAPANKARRSPRSKQVSADG